MHTLGPIYVLSPIYAAFPSLLPIVTNCDKLQLFPIEAVGFTITGPPCPIYNPYPTLVSYGICILFSFY